MHGPWRARAGGTGQEFTPEACALVHSETGGVPRLVNQLCDFAMLYAWSGEVKVIDHTIVQLVLNDGVLFAAPNRREAEHYG